LKLKKDDDLKNLENKKRLMINEEREVSKNKMI
jgi:hypothetical protein